MKNAKRELAKLAREALRDFIQNELLERLGDNPETPANVRALLEHADITVNVSGDAVQVVRHEN